MKNVLKTAFVAVLALCFSNVILGSNPGDQKENRAFKPSRGVENGHEWVDLGLSVKWATCNIGASSPSAFGSYFAWGEVSPKKDYTWISLRFCTDEYGGSFSKYNTEAGFGPVDNRTVLERGDDAACVNWGGRWRMPTFAELQELVRNCTFRWTTLGGKKGYRLTSKKNGNSIFLPAAGSKVISASGRSFVTSAGEHGYYWSSSLATGVPDCAFDISFSFVSESIIVPYSFSVHWGERYQGFTIRPVFE